MNAPKRKRTVVSYTEPDQLADLLMDDENIATVPSDESSDDESDNDDRTYSKNKVCLSRIFTHKTFDSSIDAEEAQKGPDEESEAFRPSSET